MCYISSLSVAMEIAHMEAFLLFNSLQEVLGSLPVTIRISVGQPFIRNSSIITLVSNSSIESVQYICLTKLDSVQSYAEMGIGLASSL